jgi:hypothetical protein
MKKLILLLLLATSLTSFAQALEPSTYYSAEITTDGNKTYTYYFYVNKNNYVRMVNANKGLEETSVNQTMVHGTTTTYGWQNAGGVWSECQNFVFTKDLKSGNIYVHFMRVVQNEGSVPWSVIGVGNVDKFY